MSITSKIKDRINFFADKKVELYIDNYTFKHAKAPSELEINRYKKETIMYFFFLLYFPLLIIFYFIYSGVTK